MAKEKKSLFDWLTGGAGSDEYTLDDLEQGGMDYMGRSAQAQKEKRSLVVEEPEEPVDGELAVDVYQTPTHIIIKAMIAGVRPEDLDISITRDMVTLRGKRERHIEGSSTSGDFFFQELYWG